MTAPWLTSKQHAREHETPPRQDSASQGRKQQTLTVCYNSLFVPIFRSIIDSWGAILLDNSIGRDLAYPGYGPADAAAFQSYGKECNAMISVSMNKSRIIAIAAISALAAFTSPSRASTLIGSEIEARYEYPSAGIEYGPPPVSILVGDGVETVINIENVTWLSIDFSASSLLITLNTILENPFPTWSGPPNFPAVTQNGPVFRMLSAAAFPSITNVVTSQGSVIVFLLNDELYINWAGWSYRTGDFVRVDFAASPVPLPAALPLFAAGLGAMGFMGWRRKRRAA